MQRSIWTKDSTLVVPRTVNGAPANRIASALQDRTFFWTIEFVVSAKHKPSDDEVALEEFVPELGARPEIAGFSVTDRVTGPDDPNPISIAVEIAQRTGMQPIIHWSGKGRSLRDLEQSIDDLEKHGLENVLFLTGDRLPGPEDSMRTRYLESVNSLHFAKQKMDSLLAAVALNPFKYREEEAMAQYLKLSKKVHAGADLIITQIGFDPTKHEEALFWMHANNCRIPIVANLMTLNAVRARYIRKNKLPGVIITDALSDLLEADERALSAEKCQTRVMRRLALQIQKLFYSGYSGIQVTGLHSVRKLLQLREAVDQVEAQVSDRLTWDEAWSEVMSPATSPCRKPAAVAPENSWYMVQRGSSAAVTPKEKRTHAAMKFIHKSFFESGLPARLMRTVIGKVARGSSKDKIVTQVEGIIKGPLVGCETCGHCRLAMTQYICPETCPKGLANGPCGGTDMNKCEFGDRECIHSRRYRLARDHDELDEMSEQIIATVPDTSRGTSSWPPYLRGERPEVNDE